MKFRDPIEKYRSLDELVEEFDETLNKCNKSRKFKIEKN